MIDYGYDLQRDGICLGIHEEDQQRGTGTAEDLPSNAYGAVGAKIRR
jgi:hypothetical protein